MHFVEQVLRKTLRKAKQNQKWEIPHTVFER